LPFAGIASQKGSKWQAIDHGFRESESISSIKLLREYFICGHPDGIFRSSDMGKTWNIVKPSVDKKVFNIYISGNLLYAIQRDLECRKMKSYFF
jgi:photosystem II stability/assembly factor-like uncharacterized protein